MRLAARDFELVGLEQDPPSEQVGLLGGCDSERLHLVRVPAVGCEGSRGDGLERTAVAGDDVGETSYGKDAWQRNGASPSLPSSSSAVDVFLDDPACQRGQERLRRIRCTRDSPQTMRRRLTGSSNELKAYAAPASRVPTVDGFMSTD